MHAHRDLKMRVRKHERVDDHVLIDSLVRYWYCGRTECMFGADALVLCWYTFVWSLKRSWNRGFFLADLAIDDAGRVD